MFLTLRDHYLRACVRVHVGGRWWVMGGRWHVVVVVVCACVSVLVSLSISLTHSPTHAFFHPIFLPTSSTFMIDMMW